MSLYTQRRDSGRGLVVAILLISFILACGMVYVKRTQATPIRETVDVQA